jgi:hypothetical protein
MLTAGKRYDTQAISACSQSNDCEHETLDPEIQEPQTQGLATCMQEYCVYICKSGSRKQEGRTHGVNHGHALELPGIDIVITLCSQIHDVNE